MTTPLLMFFVLIGTLTLASLTSEILSLKKENDTLANLRDRVRSWWVMALILSGALWLGEEAVLFLFACLSFAALREIITISARTTSDHWALAASFFLVLPVQYLSIYQDWYGFYTVFIPVYAFLGLSSIAALGGNSDNFLNRISQTQWGLMSAVFCVSHVPALLYLDIDPTNNPILLIAFLIIVVQGSDVLQYVWGKLFGNHKIAPSLSPNKTWEGFIGGVLSAGVLGACLHSITPFTPIEAFGMATIAATAGFLGGLVMSAVKRDQGIKDWSHLIEGHGGYFDRLDSMAFAAPIFFHLTRFFWS